MRSTSIALAASLWLLTTSPAKTVNIPSGAAKTANIKAEADTVKTETDTLTIIFTGDLLLDRGVRRAIERHGADHLFTTSIDSLFRASQAVVANLECPATTIHAPVYKQFIFRAEPQWLGTLKAHAITHLNLANNHSIDQGRRALMDTRRHILAAGMTPVGADSTMQRAAQPMLLAKEPRRVWLLTSLQMALENFAYLEDRPSVSQEPMDTLLQRVACLRALQPHDVIIVSLHWGAEHTLQPVPAQRVDAHRLIDAGADALICHHTHTLQTVERYRGRDIYYSIGNFIFDQQKAINTQACLVKVIVTKDNITTTPLPIHISHCTPHLTP